MIKNTLTLTYLALWVCAWIMISIGNANASPVSQNAVDTHFPLPLEHYTPLETEKAQALGKDTLSLWETLSVRIEADPFNLIASLLFLSAILHTFSASAFTKLAHKIEHRHKQNLQADKRSFAKTPVSFGATICHFMGEIEVVFGIWLIPLFLLVTFTPGHGWQDLLNYVDNLDFTEPLFVVVIMAIASSRPVVFFAKSRLKNVADLGKGSPSAWWLSILIIAPLLGSFITEPAAMTIAALLLGQQFYRYNPSKPLKYATLGLLFVNISVGGTLTHFAAPPILMVADTFHWDLMFMLTHFGWRAILGILLATFFYYIFFKKELALLNERAAQLAHQHLTDNQDKKDEEDEMIPIWIITAHCLFLGWTVFMLHHPVFFIGGFLFFIGFTIATDQHQYEIRLKTPVLVGFFLAGLVIHGGLQAWWIAPVLSSLNEVPLFIGSTLLTAVNDNAAITYLASMVPAFSPDELVHGKYVLKSSPDLMQAIKLQYAVVAGAVTGGGLTVIANAPNPAGQSILKSHFNNQVSPVGLFLAALLPTIIMAIIFMFLPH